MSEDNVDIELGARERKLTDTGFDYQVSVKERNFKSSLSALRSQSNKLYVLLSDTNDLQALRVHRDILQSSFEVFAMCFHDLQSLKEDVSEEMEKYETT